MSASAIDSALEFPPLPSFKGTPGWEFTPLGKLDVDAYVAAPGGDAASATERQLFTFENAEARERHPDIVAKHLSSIVKPSRKCHRSSTPGPPPDYEL